MKILRTETKIGFKTLHQNQPVIYVTQDGEKRNSIVLSVGNSKSLIRFLEDLQIKEQRVSNLSLIPVKLTC